MDYAFAVTIQGLAMYEPLWVLCWVSNPAILPEILNSDTEMLSR